MHGSRNGAFDPNPKHAQERPAQMILPPQATASSSSSGSPTRPPSFNHPLPTPHPAPIAIPSIPTSFKPIALDHDNFLASRKRSVGKSRQQESGLSLRADGNCSDVDNDVLSCEPTAGAVVLQDEWLTFSWSTRNPRWNQVDDVKIYLFHADSGDQIWSWQENKTRGTIQVFANDTIWGAAGASLPSGQNASYPLYFVIIAETATVHNGEPSEPVFTALQTTLPDSILLSSTSAQSVASRQSITSAAAASSLASLSSISSVSQASTASTLSSVSTRSSISASSTRTSATNPSSGLQPDAGNGHFPGWGIALIVVFGFFTIAALLFLAYFVMRRMRNKKSDRPVSMGSASPMMAPLSPTHPGGVGSGIVGGAGSVLARDSSVRRQNTDGASFMSGSDGGPFSAHDAAIISDAFRSALRKPDLSARIEESGDTPPDEVPPNQHIMRQELAEDGANLHHVAPAHNVRVEDSLSGDHEG